MRRKSRQMVTAGSTLYGQHKRYMDLPPAPPKRRKLSRRLGWLKTVAAVAATVWFASVVIPEDDMEKLIEALGENFGRSESASGDVLPGNAPSGG